MSGLMDLLMSQVGGGAVEKISGQLGAPADQTQRAIGAAVPALIGGLSRNANASPDGAAALAGALDRDHGEGGLDLGGMLGMLGGGGGGGGGGLGGLAGMAGSLLGGGGGGAAPAKAADGAGILRHILGDRQSAVEQRVSKASGMDQGLVSKLLPLLAPLVMQALGGMKKAQGLDAAGLAGALAQEEKTIEESAPGGLASLLDGDGDGSVADDLAGLAGKKLLGKLF